MTASTGEEKKKRKRKLEGNEFENPPSIPYTPKELDVLLDRWIANQVFR